LLQSQKARRDPIRNRGVIALLRLDTRGGKPNDRVGRFQCPTHA
jgi:hypothetical protein